MNPQRLKSIIEKGEGIETEFKAASFELPKNIFETICAFLNRHGGHIILGVLNNGKVEGVLPEAIQSMKEAIVANVNNPQKLKPTFYLSIETIEIEGCPLVHVYVPESSQVHQTNGRIFDRNEDGDFDITDNPTLVRNLHIRKHQSYTENNIYPYLKLSDLREDLIQRSRTLAQNHHPGHFWSELDNEQLLRSAGLYQVDFQSGKEGYTLAAALLLGKDVTIKNILPYHKTDAILRVEDLDRYDDREIITTNLIESYDQIMAFIRKHLPSKFYLEGDQSISLRDTIFREIAANLLVHREFTNAFPAKLIIEKGLVRTENWNRPNGNGIINPASFSPFPKNPVIAAFFRAIGRVEELGSGLRKISKYIGQYATNGKVDFVEGDTFKMVIHTDTENDTENEESGPVNEAIDTINDTVKSENDTVKSENDTVKSENDTVKDAIKTTLKDAIKTNAIERIIKIVLLVASNPGRKRIELMEELSVSEITVKRDMQKIKELVIFQGPPKTGGYYLTEKMKKKLLGKDE